MDIERVKRENGQEGEKGGEKRRTLEDNSMLKDCLVRLRAVSWRICRRSRNLLSSGPRAANEYRSNFSLPNFSFPYILTSHLAFKSNKEPLIPSRIVPDIVLQQLLDILQLFPPHSIFHFWSDFFR